MTVMRYAQVFLNILHHPRSLKEECRGVIRQGLNNLPFNKVPHLPLPEEIKDYVLMKDILRVEMEDSSSTPNSPQ